MKADTLTLKQVFSKDIRYVVPMFQRPYVWNRTKHWAPLWEDVQNTTERYLRNLAAGGTRSSVQAEQQTIPHFLGAIVVDQIPTDTLDVEARHVIDGQQRLTTLQLLLDAVQEVLASHGLARDAKLLAKLVLNDDDVIAGRDDRFKVWPTTVDQEAFRAAMDDNGDAADHQGSAIADAHAFFVKQADTWLRESHKPEEAGNALSTALHGLFQLVVIDLEPHDNAQVIFETLNARGTPLLAADLIKNHVMQRALEDDLRVESVYHDYWQVFDSAYWRADVKQGRLTRPRVDLFLDYWLESQSTDLVAAHDVFPAFRDLLRESSNLIDLVSRVNRDGHTYQMLVTNRDHSPEGTFLYRWAALEAQGMTPLLLWLFGHPEVGEVQRRLALRSLESWLVRRTVCGEETSSYSRFFLETLAHLVETGPADAGDVLTSYLQKQTANASHWPHDDDFAQALLARPLYSKLKRARLRVILEAVEDHLRSPKSEDGHVTRGKLTIEHLLPQGWTSEAWPLPGAADILTETRQRGVLLHSLGNLTLVTDRLNPALSNGSWKHKRPKIDEHGVLRLHAGFRNEEAWDEAHILRRGRALAEMAIELWRRPESRPANLDLAVARTADSLQQSDSGSPRSHRPTTLQWLLEEEVLEVGELLVDQTRDGTHQATIDEDGMVVIASGERFRSPSGASKQLRGRASNGWHQWRVPRLGNKRLSKIRDEADSPRSPSDDE